MPTDLPERVVKEDQRLAKAADDLAKLRWHWTLDETNPGRVSLREYSRQVGRGITTIRKHANGYAKWLAARGTPRASGPGVPQTIEDFVALEGLTTEHQEAVQAVAKHSGTSVTNVAANKRDEVGAVVAVAHERAISRGTTVEHEIDRAAQRRAAARETAKAERDERQKAKTLRWIEIEGHVGYAIRRLRQALDASAGVDFTDEQTEFLTDSLGKLRSLLHLMDLRIAGTTGGIDWDAEMQKLTAG